MGKFTCLINKTQNDNKSGIRASNWKNMEHLKYIYVTIRNIYLQICSVTYDLQQTNNLKR